VALSAVLKLMSELITVYRVEVERMNKAVESNVYYSLTIKDHIGLKMYGLIVILLLKKKRNRRCQTKGRGLQTRFKIQAQCKLLQFLFVCFETKYSWPAQAFLEFMVFLPQPPECWNYRYAPSRPARIFLCRAEIN
jgi:hypothetical protein